MKRKLAVTALVLTAITGCGTTSYIPPSRSPAPSVTLPMATVTAIPSMYSSPAPTADVTSQAEALVTWYNASGSQQMIVLEKDCSGISADATASNLPAVEADGSKLSADAQTANGNPPPFDTADYSGAMEDYSIAGTDIAAGDFTGGTTEMDSGSLLVESFTAKVDKLAAEIK
jgi:hypothetical protein